MPSSREHDPEKSVPVFPRAEIMLEQKIAQAPDSTMLNQAPEITMPRFGPRKLALSGWHYRASAASRVADPTRAGSSN
jgi:hypothetical protein